MKETSVFSLLDPKMTPREKIDFIIQSSKSIPLSAEDKENIPALIEEVRASGELIQAHTSWAKSEGISLPE